MHRKGTSFGDMRTFDAGPVHSGKNPKEAPDQLLAFTIQGEAEKKLKYLPRN